MPYRFCGLLDSCLAAEDPVIADAWSTALLCLGQKEGMKAANAEKIPALFIEQQDSELIESRSDALNTLDSLTIH